MRIVKNVAAYANVHGVNYGVVGTLFLRIHGRFKPSRSVVIFGVVPQRQVSADFCRGPGDEGVLGYPGGVSTQSGSKCGCFQTGTWAAYQFSFGER